MGLVLDATVSGTASNAYTTYASCTNVLLMDIHKTTEWSTLSTNDAEASIIMATFLLDSQVDYIGIKASTTQKLRWPRIDAVDPDGNNVDSTTIPDAIRIATSFYSYYLATESRMKEPDTYGFKQLEAGSLKMIVDKYDRKPVIPNIVWDLIKPYGTKVASATRTLERK